MKQGYKYNDKKTVVKFSTEKEHGRAFPACYIGHIKHTFYVFFDRVLGCFLSKNIPDIPALLRQNKSSISGYTMKIYPCLLRHGFQPAQLRIRKTATGYYCPRRA